MKLTNSIQNWGGWYYVSRNVEVKNDFEGTMEKITNANLKFSLSFIYRAIYYDKLVVIFVGF